MRPFFILIFLILSAGFVSGQKPAEAIPWDKNRPLVWKDFKGKPASVTYHAQTYGQMSYSFSSLPSGEMKIIVHVTFDPKRSWVKPGKASNKLLVHEQCHFDVFEIYARIFVKRLTEEKVLTGKDFSTKVQKVFSRTFEELQKFQQQYDKETDHSINEIKQAEWTAKISGLLEDYEAYTTKEISFMR
ncbi:MAG: hypothetical protein ACK40G_10930 [Cytophagaceae bacterium]